jgi:hypothetical protein
MLAVQRDGARSILRLRHQVEVRLLHEHRGESGPNDRMIVGYQDTGPSTSIARALVPTHRAFSPPKMLEETAL